LISTEKQLLTLSTGRSSLRLSSRSRWCWCRCCCCCCCRCCCCCYYRCRLCRCCCSRRLCRWGCSRWLRRPLASHWDQGRHVTVATCTPSHSHGMEVGCTGGKARCAMHLCLAMSERKLSVPHRHLCPTHTPLHLPATTTTTHSTTPADIHQHQHHKKQGDA
jgi:hypothetical protein